MLNLGFGVVLDWTAALLSRGSVLKYIEHILSGHAVCLTWDSEVFSNEQVTSCNHNLVHMFIPEPRHDDNSNNFLTRLDTMRYLTFTTSLKCPKNMYRFCIWTSCIWTSWAAKMHPGRSWGLQTLKVTCHPVNSWGHEAVIAIHLSHQKGKGKTRKKNIRFAPSSRAYITCFSPLYIAVTLF